MEHVFYPNTFTYHFNSCFMVNSRYSRDNFSLLNLKFFINTTVNWVNKQVNNYFILEMLKTRKVSGNWDWDWIGITVLMKCILIVYKIEYIIKNYIIKIVLFCNVEYRLACFSSILWLKWLIEANNNNIKCNKFVWNSKNFFLLLPESF